MERLFTKVDTFLFSASPWMEPCIYNATPDAGKEDPFHELYLAQCKEDRSGRMEEKTAVNL